MPHRVRSYKTYIGFLCLLTVVLGVMARGWETADGVATNDSDPPPLDKYVYVPVIMRNAESASPAPTSTRTSTATATQTATPTITGTSTATLPASQTPTETAMPTLTSTPTATLPGTPTLTPTSTWTPTPSPSPTQQLSVTATPTLTATPTQLPTKPGDVPFGISMAGEFENAAMRGAVLNAGARWTRTAVYWSGVEPSDADLSNPSYSGWGWSDTYLTAAVADGLTPVVILWSTPNWAADPSMPDQYKACGPFSDTGLDDWAEFVGAFAKRYDGDADYNDDGTADGPAMPNIRYVEIFNEPDFDYTSGNQASDEGGCWGHNGGAEKYGEALRRAYLAMTAGNPSIQIVFGAVAYERFTSNPGFVVDGGAGPFRYDFLDRVLQYLSNNYGTEPGFPFFHVLSFHNYNDFRNNWDGWGPDGSRAGEPRYPELIGKVNHLRAVKLAPFGLQHVPMMCSECSLASGPADPWTDRSEELQSMYPAQVLARSKAAGLDVTLWHTLVDPGWYDYGLFRSASSSDAKPAYHTYEVATQYLGSTSFDKQLPVSGADGTGSAHIEAYRFTRSDGSKLIVLWTDTGERLGKRSTSPVTGNMTFTTAHFGAWTGKLRVVERDGAATTLTGDSSITVAVDQSPRILYMVP